MSTLSTLALSSDNSVIALATTLFGILFFARATTAFTPAIAAAGTDATLLSPGASVGRGVAGAGVGASTHVIWPVSKEHAAPAGGSTNCRRSVAQGKKTA